MAFEEMIRVRCDETGRYLGCRAGYPHPRLFVNHREALEYAEEKGWFVTDQETLSPEGYAERYPPHNGHVLHKCNEENCRICNGGLAFCLVCQGAEGELTTDCPGDGVTTEQRHAVMMGELDYVNGEWQEKGGSQ